jgi:hypothetical protein
MAGADARDLVDRDLNFVSRLYFVSFASFVVTPFFIDSFFCPRFFCLYVVELDKNHAQGDRRFVWTKVHPTQIK